MRTKYHDKMTPEEEQQLLKDLRELDAAFAQAGPDCDPDCPYQELRKAALNHRGQP
jgi:hypothetical protein